MEEGDDKKDFRIETVAAIEFKNLVGNGRFMYYVTS